MRSLKNSNTLLFTFFLSALLISLMVWVLPAFADQQNHIIMKTTRGAIEIRLFPSAAPKTIERWKTLISTGFYSGLRFHRKIPDFLVQAGDPYSRDMSDRRLGTGGSGIHIKREFNNIKHKRGTVGMAHSVGNVDDTDSQFYITLQTATHLDGRFTVVGEVVKGLDVLDQIQVSDEIISMKVAY